MEGVADLLPMGADSVAEIKEAGMEQDEEETEDEDQEEEEDDDDMKQDEGSNLGACVQTVSRVVWCDFLNHAYG